MPYLCWTPTYDIHACSPVQLYISQIIFLTDCFQPLSVSNYFFLKIVSFGKISINLMAMFLHQFHCCFAGKMAPRVPQRTIAEMDTEFDELACALSKDPRDQLTSGIGLFYTFSTTKYFFA